MKDLSDTSSIKSFLPENSTEECFIAIQGAFCETIEEELEHVYKQYVLALQQSQLDQDTQVFSRIYFSDIANQSDIYSQSQLSDFLSSGFVSKIQQRPLSGNRISLFSYHIKNKQYSFEKMVQNQDGLQNCFVKGKSYQMAWNFVPNDKNTQDVHSQTLNLFHAIDQTLQPFQLNFRDNAIRTWIYVQDIDNRYADIVTGRNEYFDKIGLTEQTRYVASTGIEGKIENPKSVFHIDTLAFSNIQEEQIVRMEAPGYMSETHHYGVRFERGLRLRFGDRSHLYISGTASIDTHGEVLHLGDSRKQTERAIKNVSVLLEQQNAGLNDLMYLFVYLRDPNSYQQVQEVLKKKIRENIPVIFLEGAVCRPEWLVEIEGVAIIPDKNQFPLFI